MEVKDDYKTPAPVQENPYELVDFNTNVRRNDDQSREATASWNKGSKQSTWILLLVVILCLLLVQLAARDATSSSKTTTGAIAGNNEYPNFTEWANDIVFRVNKNHPELVNNIVSKVNSNVTGSLPDFNEWNNTNFTELDEQILQTTRDSAQKLINIVNTLSNLQDTSTSTAGVADDILLIAQELLVLHNESTALPTSCEQIHEQQPNSPSGYYTLAVPTGTYTTYCNMGTLCGSGKGWTRLAYLDMSDATQSCPSGFRLYQSGGVRACGRPVTNSELSFWV
uniref:Fibrinogen C-terminal domain-containing protein n=1 Tax=Amphimedon queenslandica TaxID=400682 RepID=A0A1X7TD09_AMPQE